MSFVLTKKGKKYFDIKNSIAELNWVHDDIDILAERIFNIIFSYPDCVRIGVAMTCIFILLTGFDDDVDNIDIAMNKYGVVAVFLMSKFDIEFELKNIIN